MRLYCFSYIVLKPLGMLLCLVPACRLTPRGWLIPETLHKGVAECSNVQRRATVGGLKQTMFMISQLSSRHELA